MTEQQIAEYRRRLTSGKVKPDKVSQDYAFQRAWNEGVEFCERQLDAVLKDQGKYTSTDYAGCEDEKDLDWEG